MMRLQFVKDVTAEIMARRGDKLPVSKMPVDGKYPDRHDTIRKTKHRGQYSRMGAGGLHPVRPVFTRLPARDNKNKGL